MIDPMPGLQIGVLLLLLSISPDQVVFLFNGLIRFLQSFLRTADPAFVFRPKRVSGADFLRVELLILCQVNGLRQSGFQLFFCCFQFEF